MKKRQVIVIGLGIFGIKLVEELSRRGACVIAIDQDISKINNAQDFAALTLQLDSTDKKALEKSPVNEADVVIVGIGENLEASILTTRLLKEIGVKEIIARASSSIHAKILKEIGADKIIFPEENIAQNLARSIIVPGVKEYIKLRGPWDLSEIEIGPNNKFIGKKIEDLEARKKYHVNILMITRVKKRELGCEEVEVEERVQEFPRMDYILKEGDNLVVYGGEENLERFERVCEE